MVVQVSDFASANQTPGLLPGLNQAWELGTVGRMPTNRRVADQGIKLSWPGWSVFGTLFRPQDELVPFLIPSRPLELKDLRRPVAAWHQWRGGSPDCTICGTHRHSYRRLEDAKNGWQGSLREDLGRACGIKVIFVSGHLEKLFGSRGEKGDAARLQAVCDARTRAPSSVICSQR